MPTAKTATAPARERCSTLFFVTTGKHEDGQRRLNLLYTALHRHEERLSKADPDFEEGSSLAQDSARSAVLQPGFRAYFHLRSTYEFLDSIGRLVRERKSFSPFGVEQAMGRTALLGACKAIYLLEPGSSDARLMRCAMLALEDDKSSLREIKDTLKVLGEDDSLHPTWKAWGAKLEKDAAAVRGEAELLGITLTAWRGDGELFRHVGEYLDKVTPLPQPEDLEPSKSISHEAILVRYWNQTSGYVHAHTWPFMRLAKPTAGTNELTIAVHTDDVVGLLMVIWDILDNAIELLDRRGCRHDPGASFVRA